MLVFFGNTPLFAKPNKADQDGPGPTVAPKWGWAVFGSERRTHRFSGSRGIPLLSDPGEGFQTKPMVPRGGLPVWGAVLVSGHPCIKREILSCVHWRGVRHGSQCWMERMGVLQKSRGFICSKTHALTRHQIQDQQWSLSNYYCAAMGHSPSSSS